jgi:Spy/CpxP family protein refolding chaperone
LCLVLTPAFVVGCDRDDESEELRGAEQDDDDDDDDKTASDHRRKSPADKLCGALGCSDAQHEKIAGLLEGKKPERPSEETFTAANTALASAWKDADFDAADLAAWRDTVHDEDGPKFSGQTIVSVHAVLDAKQRDMVADMFEERGAGKFFGHRGKGGHGKGHKKGGKAGKGGKGPEFAVESLCERVSCTADQRTTIAAALERGRPQHDRDEAADAKLAEAFRADTLPVAEVETYLAGMKQKHEAKSAERDAVMVSIHHALTPEQRATLATDIAEHGPRGIIKGGGHGGRGHKKGGKPGGKRGGGEQPA